MKTLFLKSTCVLPLLFVAASLPAADVVLHWTGTAGDGKWSTPGNWQENVAPNTVGTTETRVFIFPAGSVSSNDYASFGLKQMKFTGSGESVVSGGQITFNANAGDGMINVVDSKVTISNTVLNSWGSCFYCSQGELIFAGPVLNRDPATTRKLTVSIDYGKFNPDAKVRFLAGVTGQTGSNIDFDLQLGRADDFGKSYCHHLESALNVRDFVVGGTYRTVTLQIDGGGQTWRTIRLINGYLIAGAANVFCPTGVIVPNSTVGDNISYIDLNGFDQTIDRIGGTYRNTGVKSASPATLTMNATDDGNLEGPIDGSVSLVWNPSGASTFTASGANQTDGDIDVRGGVFCVSGAGSFKNVKNLSVASGAEFVLATSTAGALAAAESVQLDGTLTFNVDDATPLPKAKIALGDNGKLKVEAGKTITIPAVKVNGEYVADTDYSGVAWIDGEGTIRVDSSLITQGELIWKNAADGYWNVAGNWFGNAAPDGSKPQTIAVGGADFTVTVPGGTTIGNALRVGGHAQAGTATLATAGAATLTAGSRTTVAANGRLAVPTNATLTIAADTAAATSDKTIELLNGGLFEVCGGQLTADDLYGLFSVGAGGTFAVSSGRADVQGHAPSPSSSGAIHGLRVTDGGTAEVSGDGVLAVHSGRWGAFALVTVGGTVKVKDNGTLLFDSTHAAQGKEYSEYIGGSGKIELSGNGKVAFDDGTAGSITFPCVYGNGQIEVDVKDNAAFCFTNGTVVMGKSFWYGPSGNASFKLTLDSSADNYLGNSFILGADGRNGLTATMDVKSGRVILGGDGLKMARRSEPQDTITSPVASINVSGGALIVNGANADQGEAYYTGFELGNSLPEDNKTSASAVYTATITQTGGVVSNRHGRITMGNGKALGRYVMSAGSFVSGSRAAAFFGAYDGEGRWEMTGGTATFNETIYLGIGSTLATLLGSYAKCNLGTHVVGTAAKGILNIEGGTFTTAGDIIAGTDGNTGSVSVGPAGTLSARNLRLLNAASDTLTVKVGSDGAGAINLSGTLDLASGIKLSVIGADTYAGAPARFDILTCADSTLPLADLTVEGVPSRMKLIRSDTRLRLVTDPSGLVIFVK